MEDVNVTLLNPQFSEVIKLNGVEFHGNKHAKTWPRTICSNNTYIKRSNLLEPLLNIAPPKPANPTRSNADQLRIHNRKDSYLYSDAIMPSKKDVLLFAVIILWGMRMKDMNFKINPFLTNIPLTDKPGSLFSLAKCLENTCGWVTFSVKMQVMDLHLYLKCHSSTGVFQTFC